MRALSPALAQLEKRPLRLLWFALAGLIFLLNSFFIQWLSPDRDVESAIPAMIGVAILSAPIFFQAAINVSRSVFMMNEQVAIAIAVSCLTNNYRQAGMVALFMLLAEIIEKTTARGAAISLDQLMKLTPRQAIKLNENGEEIRVAATELKTGDLVRVRPGENFVVDGEIIRGESTANQAPITGESLPVEKGVEDEVFAGTQNLSGILDIRVTRAAEDATLKEIQNLIEKAQTTRGPSLGIIDRYAKYYSFVAFSVAVVTWVGTHDIDRVISVLITCYPDSAILATPVALLASLASTARVGVMMRHMVDLEKLSACSAFVFDKTGTLTVGKLTVSNMKPQKGTEPAELLKIAASAEASSSHPMARAIVEVATEARIQLIECETAKEVHGRGIEAKIAGRTVLVGRESWLREQGLQLTIDQKDLAEAEGQSMVGVAEDGKLLGWITAEDSLKKEAPEAVRSLAYMGIRHLSLVTGDRQSVGHRMAEAAGIKHVSADCLPKDKVNWIEDLQAQGHQVAFVGDGINDGPALAASDVGIAMGESGSDLAVHSATLALMNDSLDRLPYLLHLSRMTRRVILQNIVFGVSYAVVGAILSTTGLLSPEMAAMTHLFDPLVIAFNSARLIRIGEELGVCEVVPDRFAQEEEERIELQQVAVA
ncbi:MAG: cation-translocating P-type ATPase [Planctomycetota bacterium]|nr:cation-translocating P-type ATPase [Planctomycetota bacterium]MDA1142200.1 cation-translocating P-type ATPase [Planctomycetota bacterium]